MAEARRVLIVNADDLGRTPGINDGIFRAHRDGIVTSATLMVGFPAAVDAAAEWQRQPALGVGLHVTLTGSRPLLPAERVPSLLGPDGRFPAKPEGHRDPAPAEVLAETRAQVDRFRELTGRPPTHLDSHHHSHRLPVVLEALIAVAAELRVPVRHPGGGDARRLRQAGVPTSDAFVERFFGEEATLEVLVEILDELPTGVTELMCHPARVDEELRRDSSYTDARERELEVLTSAAARAAIEERGIHLATFAEVSSR